MKKKYKLLLSLLIVVGVERFCHHQTGPFCHYKAVWNREDDPVWKADALSEEEEREVAAALSQPYSYLGNGAETTSFVSSDGKTVLKLFKLHPWRPAFFRDIVRNPRPGMNPLAALNDARTKYLKRTFGSLKIAYEEMREETGLLYIHLEPTTHYKKKLTFTDKIGVKHEIDLDTTKFALQRRAYPIYPHIAALMEKNDVGAAKKCIDAIVATIEKRIALHLADRDPRIDTNFGVMGERVIEIDIGSFSKQSPDISREELARKLTLFRSWLCRYPELERHLNEKNL
jgi:hypothetical protein